METAISMFNGLITVKDNEFIEIPSEEIRTINKVTVKNVREIGKGDKKFIRFLKFTTVIGAGLLTVALVGLL